MINKKQFFLMLLTLFCLYKQTYNADCKVGSIVTTSCGAACTDATNCVQCTAAATCSYCKNAFFADNGACTGCVTSCQKCTAATGQCSQCNFKLANGASTYCDQRACAYQKTGDCNNDCTAGSNCLQCQRQTAGQCLYCDGYIPAIVGACTCTNQAQNLGFDLTNAATNCKAYSGTTAAVAGDYAEALWVYYATEVVRNPNNDLATIKARIGEQLTKFNTLYGATTFTTVLFTTDNLAVARNTIIGSVLATYAQLAYANPSTQSTLKIEAAIIADITEKIIKPWVSIVKSNIAGLTGEPTLSAISAINNFIKFLQTCVSSSCMASKTFTQIQSTNTDLLAALDGLLMAFANIQHGLSGTAALTPGTAGESYYFYRAASDRSLQLFIYKVDPQGASQLQYNLDSTGGWKIKFSADATTDIKAYNAGYVLSALFTYNPYLVYSFSDSMAETWKQHLLKTKATGNYPRVSLYQFTTTGTVFASVANLAGSTKTFEIIYTRSSADDQNQLVIFDASTSKWVKEGTGFTAANADASFTGAVKFGTFGVVLCMEGQYAKNDNTCAACNSACSTCKGAADTDCLICAGGWVTTAPVKCASCANNQVLSLAGACADAATLPDNAANALATAQTNAFLAGGDVTKVTTVLTQLKVSTDTAGATSGDLLSSGTTASDAINAMARISTYSTLTVGQMATLTSMLGSLNSLVQAQFTQTNVRNILRIYNTIFTNLKTPSKYQYDVTSAVNVNKDLITNFNAFLKKIALVALKSWSPIENQYYYYSAPNINLAWYKPSSDLINIATGNVVFQVAQTADMTSNVVVTYPANAILKAKAANTNTNPNSAIWVGVSVDDVFPLVQFRSWNSWKGLVTRNVNSQVYFLNANADTALAANSITGLTADDRLSFAFAASAGSCGTFGSQVTAAAGFWSLTTATAASSVITCRAVNQDQQWQTIANALGPICPPGTYVDGSDCKSCAANCNLCTGPNAADCLQCKGLLTYGFATGSCTCAQAEYLKKSTTTWSCDTEANTKTIFDAQGLAQLTTFSAANADKLELAALSSTTIANLTAVASQIQTLKTNFQDVNNFATLSKVLRAFGLNKNFAASNMADFRSYADKLYEVLNGAVITSAALVDVQYTLYYIGRVFDVLGANINNSTLNTGTFIKDHVALLNKFEKQQVQLLASAGTYVEKNGWGYKALIGGVAYYLTKIDTTVAQSTSIRQGASATDMFKLDLDPTNAAKLTADKSYISYSVQSNKGLSGSSTLKLNPFKYNFWKLDGSTFSSQDLSVTTCAADATCYALTAYSADSKAYFVQYAPDSNSWSQKYEATVANNMAKYSLVNVAVAVDTWWSLTTSAATVTPSPSACLKGQYKSTDGSCLACPSSCSECTDATKCSACLNGRAVVNNSCVCPANQYYVNATCVNQTVYQAELNKTIAQVANLTLEQLSNFTDLAIQSGNASLISEILKSTSSKSSSLNATSAPQALQVLTSIIPDPSANMSANWNDAQSIAAQLVLADTHLNQDQLVNLAKVAAISIVDSESASSSTIAAQNWQSKFVGILKDSLVSLAKKVNVCTNPTNSYALSSKFTAGLNKIDETANTSTLNTTGSKVSLAIPKEVATAFRNNSAGSATCLVLNTIQSTENIYSKSNGAVPEKSTIMTIRVLAQTNTNVTALPGNFNSTTNQTINCTFNEFTPVSTKNYSCYYRTSSGWDKSGLKLVNTTCVSNHLTDFAIFVDGQTTTQVTTTTTTTTTDSYKLFFNQICLILVIFIALLFDLS